MKSLEAPVAGYAIGYTYTLAIQLQCLLSYHSELHHISQLAVKNKRELLSSRLTSHRVVVNISHRELL